MPHKISMEDQKFITAYEAYTISGDDFDHSSHIRMAYIYLCEHDTEETLAKVRQTLCGFLSHLDIEPKTKYHETLTNAWILVVKHSMSITPTKNSASEFLSANPQLLNSKLLDTYYSKDILDTDLARDSFIEPNLLPLPGLGVSKTKP